MKDLARITKALADEQRLRLVAGLGEQEVCVCQLTELLGLAPSTVSKHLSILLQAGLIVGRKEGRWVHYRLAAREATPLVRATLAWLRTVLRGNADAGRVCCSLAGIMKMDPEKLCRRQAGRA
jgi:ArsR family transcriptional regulator, arsenate/arsenite/antimonite-responsive transcriptional repressor